MDATDGEWMMIEDTVPREQVINPAFVSSSDSDSDEYNPDVIDTSPLNRGAHRGRVGGYVPKKKNRPQSDDDKSNESDNFNADDFGTPSHLHSSLGLAAEDYFPTAETPTGQTLSSGEQTDGLQEDAPTDIPPLDPTSIHLPDMDELRAQGLLGPDREDDELTLYPETELEKLTLSSSGDKDDELGEASNSTIHSENDGHSPLASQDQQKSQDRPLLSKENLQAHVKLQHEGGLIVSPEMPRREGSRESDLSFDLAVDDLPHGKVTFEDRDDENVEDIPANPSPSIRHIQVESVKTVIASQSHSRSTVLRPKAPPSTPRARVTWADSVTFGSRQAMASRNYNRGAQFLGSNKSLPFVVPIKSVLEQMLQEGKNTTKGAQQTTPLDYQRPTVQQGNGDHMQMRLQAQILLGDHQHVSREANADGTIHVQIQCLRPSPQFELHRLSRLADALAHNPQGDHVLVSEWPHLRHQDSSQTVKESQPPVRSILAALHPARAPLIKSEAADRLHTYRATQHRVTFGAADEVHDNHGLCSALPYGSLIMVPAMPLPPDESKVEQDVLSSSPKLGGKRPREEGIQSSEFPLPNNNLRSLGLIVV